MPDTFILESQNADFVHGRAKRPPGPPFWILLLLGGIPAVLAVGTLALSFIAALSWQDWHALRTRGATTQGTITEAGIVRAQSTATEQQRFYEYEFAADGTIYEGRYVTRRGAVLSFDGAQAGEGGQVDILYLPEDPALSQIAGTSTWPAFSTAAAGILLVGTLLFGFALFKFVGGLKGLGVMFFRRAECVRGELVSITPPASGDPSSSPVPATIAYRFTSPKSGEVITREQKTYTSVPDPLPEPGCPVAVAYVEDNEHWLL